MSATLLKVDRVRIADVRVDGRLRPVSEAGVESLIASITETGVMKDAIHVRKKKDGSLHLIAGGHRLEAARRLGWEQIEAKVWSGVTDDWARLMEIDDNLAGAEMNALDTAVFLAERKKVYEKLHPETKWGVAGGLARQGSATELSSFAAATAAKFGITERQVRKIVAAGSALSHDELRWLRAAPAPVRLADLQALAKIGNGHERSQVCIRLSNGAAKTAAAARRSLRVEAGLEAPVKDRVDAQFLVLMSAWTRAGKAARRRFVDEAGDALAELVAEAKQSTGAAE